MPDTGRFTGPGGLAASMYPLAQVGEKGDRDRRKNKISFYSRLNSEACHCPGERVIEYILGRGVQRRTADQNSREKV